MELTEDQVHTLANALADSDSWTGGFTGALMFFTEFSDEEEAPPLGSVLTLPVYDFEEDDLRDRVSRLELAFGALAEKMETLEESL